MCFCKHDNWRGINLCNKTRTVSLNKNIDDLQKFWLKNFYRDTRSFESTSVFFFRTHFHVVENGGDISDSQMKWNALHNDRGNGIEEM